MAWTFYELRFRLLSPLHIGHQKIGNIQRTRHYVPARVLWGALTARLTRDAAARSLADVSEGDYIAMGDLVKRQLAFSYFFPTDENLQPIYPGYDEQGLKYASGQSCLTPEVFAWRYLSSYAATALNYERNAAEDASLHEVEFLSPHSRFDNASHPVHLLGYAIAAAGCKLPWPILTTALQEIQIGGERRYGWGRLRLDRAEEHGRGEAVLFGQLHCDAKTEARPELIAQNNETLLAHTAATGIAARGEIEPLVGRVWEQNKGAGQTVEFTDVCYALGAKLEGSRTFEMTATHIWRAKSPQP
jgi:hypothetical protein